MLVSGNKRIHERALASACGMSDIATRQFESNRATYGADDDVVASVRHFELFAIASSRHESRTGTTSQGAPR
jgi:hypothetical protein